MNRTKINRKIEEIQRTIAHLFAHKGYHATSARDNARELEMQPASLYHYFSGKEEMLFVRMNASMDEALEELRDRYRVQYAKSRDDDALGAVS